MKKMQIRPRHYAGIAFIFARSAPLWQPFDASYAQGAAGAKRPHTHARANTKPHYANEALYFSARARTISLMKSCAKHLRRLAATQLAPLVFARATHTHTHKGALDGSARFGSRARAPLPIVDYANQSLWTRRSGAGRYSLGSKQLAERQHEFAISRPAS